MRYLLATFLYLTTCNAIAQPNKFKTIVSHLDVNAGASLHDGYGAGVRYLSRQSQVGVSIHSGVMTPWCTLSYYRHLAGKSRFTQVKPWFCKLAMSYHQIPISFLGTNYSKASQKVIDAYLGFGREININQHIGLMLTAGPFYRNALPPKSDSSVVMVYPADDRFSYGFDFYLFYRLAKG